MRLGNCAGLLAGWLATHAEPFAKPDTKRRGDEKQDARHVEHSKSQDEEARRNTVFVEAQRSGCDRKEDEEDADLATCAVRNELTPRLADRRGTLCQESKSAHLFVALLPQNGWVAVLSQGGRTMAVVRGSSRLSNPSPPYLTGAPPLRTCWRSPGGVVRCDRVARLFDGLLCPRRRVLPRRAAQCRALRHGRRGWAVLSPRLAVRRWGGIQRRSGVDKPCMDRLDVGRCSTPRSRGRRLRPAALALGRRVCELDWTHRKAMVRWVAGRRQRYPTMALLSGSSLLSNPSPPSLAQPGRLRGRSIEAFVGRAALRIQPCRVLWSPPTRSRTSAN